MSVRPRTLRGRLALWYTAVLSVVLIAFSVTVYFIAAEEDEVEDARHQEHEEREAERVLLALAVGLPVGIVLALCGGLWITRRGFAPLDEMARVASELGADSLGRRIPMRPGAGSEVERVIEALNAMLERLDRSVTGLRQFTADASHELRTPVAVLLGEVELALRQPRTAQEQRQTLERVEEGLSGLARLTESLLTLARSDANELSFQLEDVSVVQVIGQVVSLYAPIASDNTLRLEVRCPPELVARAEPLWLGRALANLVDNACKFTPAGGTIVLSAQARLGRVFIRVDDTGVGLSQGQEERIFERFYRAVDARGTTPGFGLGLAIAREVLRAMGGDLRYEPKIGAGASFVIELSATTS